VPFSQLQWKPDRELIISRVLAEGNWSTIQWLRNRIGDAALRSWLRHRQGRGLSRQQLRYWELMLNLSRNEVDHWLALEGRRTWDLRSRT